MAKATQAGQRIYHITQENMAAALPNIHHDADTMDEIRAALAVGKEVITHTDAVSVPGWKGAGYIIMDPDTGIGAYKIGGGMNGSFLAGIILAHIILLAALSIMAFTMNPLLAGLALGAMLAAVVPFISLLSGLIGKDNFDAGCFSSGLMYSLVLVGLIFTPIGWFIGSAPILVSSLWYAAGLRTKLGELPSPFECIGH